MFKYVFSATQVQQLNSEGECEFEQALQWSRFTIGIFKEQRFRLVLL